MNEILLSILIYFSAGAFTGVLSGLFGIGGGTVVVPVLLFIFTRMNFAPSVEMHLAAGTSLGVMLMTTTSSFISHRRYDVHFGTIYRQTLPGIIVGVILGATLAHYMHSNSLKIACGILLLLVGIKMLFETRINPNRQLPGRKGMASFGGLVGIQSGLFGIGGGALVIPFLTHHNVPMRQAVLISIVISASVAVIGSISLVVSGWNTAGLPQWSTGYLYWPACLSMGLGSVSFAPLGAYWSHHTPVGFLKRVFAVLLVLIGVQMIW